VCCRRENGHDAESNNSNNDKTRSSRRQSLLPASQLHLQVSCFAVRPAAANVTESSPHSGSKEDGPDMSMDQLFSVPSKATSDSRTADFNKDGEVGAGDSVNVDIFGELSTGLSGRAVSVKTGQGASENTTQRLVADSAALNGARSELPPTPYVPSAFSSTESRVGRGGRMASRRPVGRVRGRGRLSSSSAPQPSSTSLNCPAADDLLK